jgi:uncharacterized damage-inducible protein DinB
MINSNSQALLRDGFTFELYANRLWLPAVLGSGGDTERSIFQHILSASRIWIVRFAGMTPMEAPVAELTEKSLLALHQDWMSAVEQYAYAERIEYVNLRGVPTSGLFGDIARHVVNHGTYHRGQLRELFGSKGVGFPETDFLSYASGRTLEL